MKINHGRAHRVSYLKTLRTCSCSQPRFVFQLQPLFVRAPPRFWRKPGGKMQGENRECLVVWLVLVKKYDFNYFWKMETAGLRPQQGETFILQMLFWTSHFPTYLYVLKNMSPPLGTTHISLVELNTSNYLKLWISVFHTIQTGVCSQEAIN